MCYYITPRDFDFSNSKTSIAQLYEILKEIAKWKMILLLCSWDLGQSFSEFQLGGWASGSIAILSKTQSPQHVYSSFNPVAIKLQHAWLLDSRLNVVCM